MSADRFPGEPATRIERMWAFIADAWPYFILTAVFGVLLAAGAFVFETLPPWKIVMATGPEGGANLALGERYRQILADSGVGLQLRPTSGSLENLKLLRDPHSGVDVALLQDGAMAGADISGVEALGSVGFEPLWVFMRAEIGSNMRSLSGRRVSIGPDGSGARVLALELLKRSSDPDMLGTVLDFSPQIAADKLIAGDIDAAMIVSAWSSPAVQTLLNAEGITLVSFRHADALVTLYPFLTKLVLPSGILDLWNNRPPANVVLLAPKTVLAVRTDLHPATQYLLLSAAKQIHSPAAIFQQAAQFPASDSTDLPLSPEAEGFFKIGQPFLQRQFPFWIAVLIGRALVVLVPLAAIAYPVFRLMPMMYHWIMRWRIQSLYGEMRSVEATLERTAHTLDDHAVSEHIDRLEQSALNLWVPRAYRSALYALRLHIGLIRGHIDALRASGNRSHKASGPADSRALEQDGAPSEPDRTP